MAETHVKRGCNKVFGDHKTETEDRSDGGEKRQKTVFRLRFSESVQTIRKCELFQDHVLSLSLGIWKPAVKSSSNVIMFPELLCVWRVMVMSLFTINTKQQRQISKIANQFRCLPLWPLTADCTSLQELLRSYLGWEEHSTPLFDRLEIC